MRFNVMEFVVAVGAVVVGIWLYNSLFAGSK